VTAAIFVGPSLDLHTARTVLPDAVFLPPAKQADLIGALGAYQPDVIGLIDGSFGQSLSVWHKEILFALEQGVAVLGAASMGALRAVELGPFGMQGVGEVYGWFSAGVLQDDDEVAVLHAPAEQGFRPITEPMVNIRATLARAREDRILTPAECEDVLGGQTAPFFESSAASYPGAHAPVGLRAGESIGVFHKCVRRRETRGRAAAVGNHSRPWL
jgi:hypothetical protein